MMITWQFPTNWNPHLLITHNLSAHGLTIIPGSFASKGLPQRSSTGTVLIASIRDIEENKTGVHFRFFFDIGRDVMYNTSLEYEFGLKDGRWSLEHINAGEE